MSYVSILHAPGDELIAGRIAEALAREGCEALAVSSDEATGDLAIDDAPSVVVWTPRAVRAPAIGRYAREAMARGTLIPVSLAGAAPPEDFRSLPPADLTGWTGDARDPRWRFVAEEVRIASQRALLEDGAVWSAPERGAAPVSVIAAAPPPRDELPPDEPSARESAPASEAWAPDHPPLAAPSSATGPLSAPAQAAAPYAPPPRRAGFRPRHVALGAGFALIAITVFAAVTAPIIFSRNDPSAAPPAPIARADEQPEPARLSVLTIAPAEAKADLSLDQPTDLNAPAPDLRDAGWAMTSAPDVAAPAPEETGARDDAISDVLRTEEDAASASGAMAQILAELDLDTEGASPEQSGADQALAFDDADYIRDCAACPSLVAAPPGRFILGSPPGERARVAAEGPAIVVEIPRTFAIAAHEVTAEQWAACVADGGCRGYAPPSHGWNGDRQPAVSVSFEDAQSYVAWLSSRTGRAYRLPSEAEWEDAARAGSAGPFSFGARLTPDDANYNAAYPYGGPRAASPARPVAVASFEPNAFGLYDMHGNVWEWTADCWADSHAGAAADGAPRTAAEGGDCARRVLKGGAWNTGGWRLRSAHRIGKPAVAREFDNGFRVARDLD